MKYPTFHPDAVRIEASKSTQIESLLGAPVYDNVMEYVRPADLEPGDKTVSFHARYNAVLILTGVQS